MSRVLSVAAPARVFPVVVPARSALALALLLALPAAALAADAPAPDGADVNELQRVVVSATRTERAVQDVPATVSAIDRERMDKELTRNIKDLFRYEPGIVVGSNRERFGLGDIRIRGLGGNRVRVLVDGISVSDSFSIGSFSNAGRNFVDLDTVKEVEVVRGPSSALHGSDALGGVVSFVTKDPEDYLKDGANTYFGLKLGVESQNDGLYGGATAAFGGERWSGLVVVNHHQGQETENQGKRNTLDASRTTPNPHDNDGRSLLTKLVYAPSDNQRFRLTVEGSEDQTDTDVFTARGTALSAPGAPAVRVLSQTGNDHQTRARVAFAHEIDSLDSAFADSLRWQIYRQDSETTQRTREQRVSVVGGREISPTLRLREFNFDQRVYGAEATAHKGFVTGSVEHTLTYGFEYENTEFRQKRDGRAINLTTGASTNVISPDTFPVRDFPVSKTQSAGVFVQDEIQFADGQFRLVPAVRVDRYELRPQRDAIFTTDNPGVVISDLSKTSVSPKLGAVWHFAQQWSVYGGYQRGFRAPPYSDVNLGFTNLQFGYTAIPNPNLKPETSDGYELGLRFSGQAVYAQLSAYYNDYKDFIESNRQVSAPPQTPLIVFQSQNVAKARIRGVELRGGVDFGEFSPAWAGWSLRGAAAYSKGEDKTADRPLESIAPLTATLGMAYDREQWGVELAGRFAKRKSDLPAPGRFAAPGYGVLDLLAHWNFAPGAKLNVGVFNLADKTYWDAGDLPGIAATSTVIDRYSAPGRNVGASVSVSW
ncbi:tonB-dependent hemoglobin/transferrin/lactoferrin receptor family protein [Lysobacter capsici]|uniref:TonB-dependent hemoglobin/transferrin/lactoferrin family receptor n=1 Tax=Lysobacter capsici TaxID=435897 RepID=UPI000722F841|nr:TonB-dependent hemoglobin/transferrin/lactoferrin family receptor [Lysobacter capsici]ALN84471.1 tonB-dependent hemoglobin/transferrin/lactoferrin receptor family protein [Lysobacter capsici]